MPLQLGGTDEPVKRTAGLVAVQTVPKARPERSVQHLAISLGALLPDKISPFRSEASQVRHRGELLRLDLQRSLFAGLPLQECCEAAQRMLARLGDDVRDVALDAACHADIKRRPLGLPVNHVVGRVNGPALRGVHGCRVGQFDVRVDVPRGQVALGRRRPNGERTVWGTTRYGPYLAVDNAQHGIVLAGLYKVTDPGDRAASRH